ncbi:MAG: hypothetical protein RIR39_811 [Pseudomonadota bacterium]
MIQTSTLKSISEFIRTGKTPPTHETKYFNGEIQWFTPGDLDKEKYLGKSMRSLTEASFLDKKATYFPAGTLLVACIGDIGKLGITTQDCSSNQQITGIKPNTSTDVNYLYYWFRYSKMVIQHFANNAVVPIINNGTLEKIKIPLPPLAEQQKIASVLDAADCLRQKDQQLIEKYNALSQSLFLEMFGDPVNNPLEWKKNEFGTFIDVLTDYHANGSYEVLKDNVELKRIKDYALMVRTTDLEHNNFNEDVVYISKHAYEYLEKSKVYGGEIIISKIGSAGKVFLMPYLDKPVSLGMNAFLLRFNNNLNNIFVYFLLTSKFGEIEIGKRIKGAVTKTIRKDALREISIISPPIELQNQFAERVQSIEAQKQLAQASLKKSEALFNCLLQRAFKGELTT